jgi:hypothetical protein
MRQSAHSCWARSTATLWQCAVTVRAKRKQQLRNPMTAIQCDGTMVLEFFIRDILETRL